jgi:hypothetical protein
MEDDFLKTESWIDDQAKRTGRKHNGSIMKKHSTLNPSFELLP